MSKAPPPEGYDDNPEWNDDDFARSRPASVVHAAPVAGALVKRGRGRPTGSGKDRVTLRIDHDILERFRAGGRGWQTRINEALRKATG